jgi:hypothetical protein
MDDPLLARARLLVAMSAGQPAIHSASSSFTATTQIDEEGNSPVPPPRKRTETHNSSDSATQKFRCSVFKGSSLVTVLFTGGTGGDIRSILQKGKSVEIDGSEYQISTKQFAEWSATRFELSVDYPEETNLDASLCIHSASRRSPKKKLDAEPIPTADIRNAIQILDSIPESFRIVRSDESKPLRKIKEGKSMNLTEKKKSMGDFTGDVVSSQGIVSRECNAPFQPVVTKHESPMRWNHAVVKADGNNFTSPSDYEGDVGYLGQAIQARQGNTESQRKRAMMRVMRKIKDDQKEEQHKKQVEDMAKEAHRQAMEVKAAKLREKTLQRVAQLNAAKAEAHEVKQAIESVELSKKLESASMVQTETYKQRMLRMKKDTQRRLQQIRLEEEEREQAEKNVMNKKLSEIADARRRVDRDIPKGYIPPVHTQVIRQTKSASSTDARLEASSRNTFTESRDDTGNHAINKGLPITKVLRSPSPIVESVITRAGSAGRGKAVVGPEENRPAEQYLSFPNRSMIPVSTRVTSMKKNDDDNDLSDDSLENPPDAGCPPQHTSNKSAPPKQPLILANAEDVSVITFDSPTRPKHKQSGTRKKVWKALKPLPIPSYTSVPQSQLI